MRKSVKQELIEYGVARLIDLQPSEEQLNDSSEIHFHLFNEDYYIIGYYECGEWLKQHEIDIFDGISWVNEQEDLHFGEPHSKIEDSEKLVNLIVYFVGYEIVDEIIKEYKNRLF